MKSLVTTEVKCIRKALGLFSKDVQVENPKIKGKFTVIGYRQYYGSWSEIDIIFEGQIYCRLGPKVGWFGSSILKNDRVSKICVNRFIRRNLFTKVDLHSKLFGISLLHYSQIKKLKWKS